MKKSWMAVVALGVIAAVPLLTGCEWESGGGDESSGNWNSRYGIFDFGGIYRGANGGLLITDYTIDPGVPGGTNTVQETVGTGNGVKTVFSGSLARRDIVTGSVTISGAGVVFQDNGSGLLLPSVATASTGTISYATGAYSVDYGGAAPSVGVAIVATYEYTVGNKPSVGPLPGTTKAQIFAFTVYHQGEHLRIVDNTGAQYDGRIITIRTSGGGSSETPAELNFTNNEQLMAQFEVKGTSSAGMKVTMTGFLMGTIRQTTTGGTGIGATQTTATTLRNREIQGTWIEHNGKTGNIHGYAAASAAVEEDPVVVN